MCGIVGIAAKKGLSQDQLKAFNDLLFMDTLRGWDSTGVACIHVSERDEDGWVDDALVYKRAVPAPDFLQLRAYNQITKTPSRFRALLGHNRSATRGAVVDDNAHPFQHGGITLVHNGSLSYYSNLVPLNSVTVDSEAIAIAISKAGNTKGVVETIEKIQGAFSLVWHDASTDWLWFARNEDRPMNWCRLLDKDDTIIGFMWASEPSMLQWAACRRGIKIGPIVSTDVGRLMAVDMNETFEVVFDETVDTYVKKYTAGGYNAWDQTRTANNSGQGTYGAAQQNSGKTYQSSQPTSAGTGLSASQKPVQEIQTSSSGTSSQKTSKTLSTSTNNTPSPELRSTLRERKGFDDAPEYGEYIEFLVATDSFTGYSSKNSKQPATHGFSIGMACCGEQHYEYPVVIHSVPADYKPTGVYRGFVIGIGPSDCIKGEKGADITLYVTFSTCVKVDDTLQEIYQKKANLEFRRSQQRPKSAALIRLYQREVNMKGGFAKKSKACEAQLTEYALSTPTFIDTYNQIAGIERDLMLPPIETAYTEQEVLLLEHTGDDPLYAYGPDGSQITYKEFNRLTMYGCAQCSGDLFPEDSHRYLWVQYGGDACLCPDCAAIYLIEETNNVIH